MVQELRSAALSSTLANWRSVSSLAEVPAGGGASGCVIGSGFGGSGCAAGAGFEGSGCATGFAIGSG